MDIIRREPKPLIWIGRAYRELTAFPPEAMHEAGHQLWFVQAGADPDDWKPMESIGPGACELRIRISEGGVVQHRVIYVARFPEGAYVLHAFEKNTETTSHHNLDVARARYAQMLRGRGRSPSRKG